MNSFIFPLKLLRRISHPQKLIFRGYCTEVRSANARLGVCAGGILCSSRGQTITDEEVAALLTEVASLSASRASDALFAASAAGPVSSPMLPARRDAPDLIERGEMELLMDDVEADATAATEGGAATPNSGRLSASSDGSNEVWEPESTSREIGSVQQQQQPRSYASQRARDREVGSGAAAPLPRLGARHAAQSLEKLFRVVYPAMNEGDYAAISTFIHEAEAVRVRRRIELQELQLEEQLAEAMRLSRELPHTSAAAHAAELKTRMRAWAPYAKLAAEIKRAGTQQTRRFETVCCVCTDGTTRSFRHSSCAGACPAENASICTTCTFTWALGGAGGRGCPLCRTPFKPDQAVASLRAAWDEALGMGAAVAEEERPVAREAAGQAPLMPYVVRAFVTCPLFSVSVSAGGT